MNKALVKGKQQGRCQTSYPTLAPPRLSQVAHMATLSLRKQQRSRMSSPFLLHHGSSQVTCRVPSAKYSASLFRQNPPRGTSAPQATTVQSWKRRSVSRGGKPSACVPLAALKPARRHLYVDMCCIWTSNSSPHWYNGDCRVQFMWGQQNTRVEISVVVSLFSNHHEDGFAANSHCRGRYRAKYLANRALKCSSESMKESASRSS